MTPERRKEMRAAVKAFANSSLATMLTEALDELEYAQTLIATMRAQAAERNELNTR